MVQRIALGVYIACFTIGTVTHALDFWALGLRPYSWGPPILEAFWSSLVVLDPAAAGLLLFGKRRAGLALAAIIMVCDVAANSYAFFVLGIEGLQNLLVTKSKKRGQYAVIAGGRRLRAIGMIIDRGAWAADAEVECKLLEGSEETAGEASLAENFQRVGMSPAEECRAFQHFIKEGSDIAAVAKRFGLTQRFVEGRLRLANLAAPIFEALAAGDITLEIAKA
jgi:ParB/RepB/Spo0J family partition protein